MTARPVTAAAGRDRWGDRRPAAGARRRPTLWVGPALAAALALPAFLLDGPGRRLAIALNGTVPDLLGGFVSNVSRFVVPASVVVAMGLAGVVRRRRALVRLAARTALALVAAALVTLFSKALIRRPRPVTKTQAARSVETRYNSMPSGHTVSAFCLAGALAGTLRRRRGWLYGYAGLVGAARVVVGAHWVSDVAVGAAIGLLLGTASRLFPRRPSIDRFGRLFSAAGDDRCPGRQAWAGAALVLVPLSLGLFLVANKEIPLIDRDEPRFAQAAREMVDSGDFVVPHFNGEYRFEKPPLAYWLMAGAYAVVGQNEFGARLPSAACATAAVLLLYALGCRLFSRPVGLLGALILLTSLQLVVEAKAATADAALLVLALAAFYAIVRLRDGGRFAVWLPVLGLALGLSNLAKGPVVLGVVCLALATHLLTSPKGRWRGAVAALIAGPILAALVSAPWFILVQVQTHGEFLNRMINDHFLAHAAHGKEGHYAIFLVYFPLLFAFFFPWSIVLPRAIGRAWRQRRAVAGVRFLLCWAAPGFVMFCLVGTKLPHYLLPLYPALALLVAWSLIKDVEAGQTPFFGRLGHVGGTAIGISAVGLAVGLPVALAAIGWPAGPVLAGVVPGVMLVIGFLGTRRALRRGSRRAALAVLAATVYLAWFGLVHAAAPEVLEFGLTPMVAPHLAELEASGTPVAAIGYKEPSLVWRLNGMEILDSVPAIEASAAEHPSAVYLLRENDYEILKAAPALAFDPLRQPGPFRGFNFANGEWVKARLVRMALRSPPSQPTTQAGAGTAPPAAP